MATIAAIAGGVLGAAGSIYGAKSANKPKKAFTDQTTTQTPYWDEGLKPDIGQIINAQRGLASQGAPTVNPDGSISYRPLPAPFYPGALDPGLSGAGASSASPPTGGAAGEKPFVPPGGRLLPDGSVVNKKGVTVWEPNPRKKGKGGGSGGPSPGVPGKPGAASPAPRSAEDIFREAAERGFEAGDTATIGQGRDAIGNILGAAGGGGPETTGFEGYNPILDRLAGTLEGDVEDRVSRDLILQLLGENKRGVGQGGQPGSPGAGGPARGVGHIIQGDRGGPSMSSAYQTTAPSAVPDAAGTGLFGTEIQKMFDEGSSEADIQALIDAMNQDVERGMFRDIAQLQASASGAGRLGGDAWKALERDAREEALQEMLKTSSGVRLSDKESRRQARLASLGLVNTRDLGSLNAQVAREQIAAGERSAGAGAAASAAALAEQSALTRRAQDLSAIGMLQEGEQFGVGQLGDIGSQLSSDRLNTLGLIPDIEGIGLGGLNIALGGGQGLTGLREISSREKIAGQQAGLARSEMNQRLGMFNAAQQQAVVNDYLRTVLGIGSMGGTSRTVGTNVVPGAGISTTGAAATGALGGAATGAGIYDIFRGGR